MPKYTRTEAQAILDSVMAAKDNLDSVNLALDSVQDLGDKLQACGTAQDAVGLPAIYEAILDGAQDYQKAHGVLPDASVVAAALEEAHTILDAATTVEGSSAAHSTAAFTPMQPIIAIRSMIATAIPFAHYISADKTSGEGSLVIVSHQAATKTGMYVAGGSLNGVQGGFTYIAPTRTHKLEGGDNTTFTGKLTPIQTKFDECDQSAAAHPLYPNLTKVFVNGILEATFKSNGSATTETTSAIVELGGEQYTLNGKANLVTGEIEVKFDRALPENSDVTVRGCLNVETDGYKTPEVKVDGKKYPFTAEPYRSQVMVTPEAERQFKDEIGIDPAFEGTFAIRSQLAQETLFGLLDDLSKIGEKAQNLQYDFDWANQGQRKKTSEIAEELLGKIEVASKTMAKANGSHGISHIYVGERLASALLSLGDEYFETSGLTARGTVYRLGRLKGVSADVYYTPKGITKAEAPEKSERMLLIGANAANPAFNPVILGEVSSPKIEPIGPTSINAGKGYLVTGKRIVTQNPVKQYAASVAVLDCINMAY